MITAANSQTCVTGQKFKNIMCVCVCGVSGEAVRALHCKHTET